MHTLDTEWARTEGSPLLLLEEELLERWQGTTGSAMNASGSGMSDYDRACEEAEYIGVLQIVGVRFALVFGDAPLDATWIGAGAGSETGYIVRVQYAPHAWDVRTFRQHVADSEFGEPGCRWNVLSRRLRLFDAAYAGSEILAPSIVMEIEPGEYEVTTATVFGDQVGCVVHRFEKAE